MNYHLKSLLKHLSSSNQRKALRRYKRHFLNKVRPRRKISLKEMRSIIVDELGIEKGDRIIVSSSFGNVNASFSPQEMIDLLMNIIGDKGVIMMPYYPPINSTEWAARHEVFDMRNTKSGMGVLTNVFSKMPGVYMSKHPTKAVCVWGKDAKEIAAGHDKATTPFYWDSPYGRLLKQPSKSLGIGLKNIPIFHSFEDILTDPIDFYYQKDKYKLDLIDKEGTPTVVETYIHDDKVLNHCMTAGDYVRDLKCSTYRRMSVGYKIMYVIDNDDLFDECRKRQFEIGNLRYRP
ncbi:MAG: AAC(3) family N-acetyltransferase [Muribaculaceae bacterium]|nr:AAC(3) family N-acetyltransferase [Muribaculaceae bacterium]